MQCSNCDRKFGVTDGQFCPYCGSPLTFSDKPKKKKHNATISYRSVDADDKPSLSVVSLIFCGLIFAVIAVTLTYPITLPISSSLVILLVVVARAFNNA